MTNITDGHLHEEKADNGVVYLCPQKDGCLASESETDFLHSVRRSNPLEEHGEELLMSLRKK